MTSEPEVLSGLFFMGVNIAGMPVKCRGCGGRFHVLTESFRREPPMRGSYLRMIPKYRSWGWYAFPESEWVVGDNVQCPQCGTPYSMSAVMEQIERFVNEKLGVGHADEQAAVPGVAEGRDESQGGAENAVGREADAEILEVEGSEDEGWRPVGTVVADPDDGPGVVDAPAGHDSIYQPIDNSPKNIKMTVMKMTADGCTQAHIAQTCNMSVYMVRQIQNGRKV